MRFRIAALGAWCRDHGWGWRLRLKRDLLVFEDGGESTLAECFARGDHMLRDIELTEKRVITSVAMVHEPDHPEPWIIALSEAPTVHRAFDYGLRWGIEALFSDFKTRGFGLENSQIQYPDRLSRLILVLVMALVGRWWGAGALLGRIDGHVGCEKPSHACRKKHPADRPRKALRSLISRFKRGLRRLQAIFQSLPPCRHSGRRG